MYEDIHELNIKNNKMQIWSKSVNLNVIQLCPPVKKYDDIHNSWRTLPIKRVKPFSMIEVELHITPEYSRVFWIP